MTGPRFDFTINLGHVLTIGGVLVTMILGYSSFDTRLKLVEETLRTSTATLIQQVQLAADVRAIDARLGRIERIVEAAK